MRSRHLFGILLSAFTAMTATAMNTGCGPDEGSAGSAGGGQGGSGASGGAGGSGGMSVDSDGNTDCATAAMLDLSGNDFPGTLKPVDVDRDYYKVALKKGQAIYLGASSKPDTDPYGETYPDTVITVYSEDGKTQIARNDDMSGSNNSELLYLVPADATYCVEVADCGAVFGLENCNPPEGITTFDYNIFAFELDPAAASVDTEPNETVAQATPIQASSFKDQAGAIAGYSSIGWGTFSSPTDKDYYSFKVASDFPVDANARALCLFEFYEPGVEGNGSTAQTGVIVNVATKANPTAIIAQIDLGVPDLTFGYVEMPTITMPCTMGTDYVFSLSRTPGETAGANDFYFVSLVEAGSNRIEKEPNDDVAETLELSPTDDMTGWVTGIGGDIAMPGAGGDKDSYKITVPAGNWLASAFCYGQRDGSGLRNLQVALTDGAGAPLKNGTAFETLEHLAYVDNALVPAGATEVNMKVIADAQDPNVSSTYYFCSLALLPQ